MHNIGVAPLPCIEEARGSTRILLQQILGPFRDSSAIISSAAGHGEGGGLAAGLEGVPRLKVDLSPCGCQGRSRVQRTGRRSGRTVFISARASPPATWPVRAIELAASTPLERYLLIRGVFRVV